MIGAPLVSAAAINNLAARLNIRWTITAGLAIRGTNGRAGSFRFTQYDHIAGIG
jgi:hypothetical protein